MPAVSQRIAEVLAHHVTDVFGVMGNGNAHLLNHLADTGIRYTAVRHEAGTVTAADAYHRTSGRLAVATCTYGPGFTNTLTALAEAVKAETPLLLVTGCEPTSGPRPWDVDQRALSRAVGAPVITVTADDPIAATRHALSRALCERTAVVLEIPYDLPGVPAGDESTAADAPLTAATHPAVDEGALDAAATALAGARRPLILAGRGAWLSGAGDALQRLADRLGAITTSSALGRGQLDARYDLGVAGGFGQDAAMDVAARADVVLAVGAGLNQFTQRFGALIDDRATVLQIDVAEAATAARVDLFVSGDARAATELLLERLGDVEDSGWRTSVAAFGDGSLRLREPGEDAAADGLLDPRSLTRELERILPDDRVMVTDGGHFIGWVNTYFSVRRPDRFAMVGTPFQAIGTGMPSLVGAAAANPDELTVLCTGDGGALMSLADLESAVRSVRRGVIVVYNDAAYGAEVHLYGLAGFDEGPMLIPGAEPAGSADAPAPGVDFAGLARAVGAEGVTVSSLEDLRGVEQRLAEGLDGVLVLDCRVSRSIRAPYQEEVIAQNASLFDR